MKRILYFTAVFLMLLPLLSGKSIVLGQNMATEYYDLNYLWNQADKTNYFNIQRCDKCGQFVVSYDKDDVDDNMKRHYKMKHPELDNSDNGYNSGSTGNETGGSSSNNNSSSSNVNAICVVDLDAVARAMERLGIINANGFIEDYDVYYGQYVGSRIYRAVLPAYINSYINRMYPLRRNVTLKTAIDNDYPFLMLSRPSQSNDGYRINGQDCVFYNVIYNQNLSEYSQFYYQYLYVFGDM